MVSMSYCRHENTASEMSQVVDKWYDYEEGDNEYEDRGRKAVVRLALEIVALAQEEGMLSEKKISEATGLYTQEELDKYAS